LGKSCIFQCNIYIQDTTRVVNLFRNPQKYGLKVTQRSLTIEDIFYFLATSGPLVALVNANLLHCLSCRWNFLLVFRYLCCDQYQGHFIVLVGYSVEKKVVYYRNPGLSDRKFYFIILIESYLTISSIEFRIVDITDSIIFLSRSLSNFSV
jgi:hypothetical protein